MANKYVICNNNCKYEALDKEETLSAIQQAIESGGVQGVDPTEPFITKIKDKNTGVAVGLWIGTEKQFNAITTKEDNTVYIYPTDFEVNVNQMLEQLRAELTVAERHITDIIDGRQLVRSATYAKGILPVILYNQYTVCNDQHAIAIDLPTIDTVVGKRLEVAWEVAPYNTICYTTFTITAESATGGCCVPVYQQGKFVGTISFLNKYVGGDPSNHLYVYSTRPTTDGEPLNFAIRRIREIPEGQA